MICTTICGTNHIKNIIICVHIYYVCQHLRAKIAVKYLIENRILKDTKIEKQIAKVEVKMEVK